METIIQTLRNEIRKLPLDNDCTQTDIPYVTVCRSTHKEIQMPSIENPYLYIVLGGMLRLHTPSGIMDYIAGQYSISKIDTPLMGTVLDFSKHQDFLALVIEFSVNDVITIILSLAANTGRFLPGQVYMFLQTLQLMQSPGPNCYYDIIKFCFRFLTKPYTTAFARPKAEFLMSLTTI